MTLSTDIAQVPGVGPAYDKRLKNLGIRSVRDLLWHFPREYRDFSKVSKAASTRAGATWCVKGRVLGLKTRRAFRRLLQVTEGVFQDSSGSLRVVWFNQPYVVSQLKGEVFLAGRVVRGKGGLVLQNPAIEAADKERRLHAGRLVAVYPETRGVSSRWLRYQVSRVLERVSGLADPLPSEVLKARNLPSLKDALGQAHLPDTLGQAKKAKERFAFEELFTILLFVLTERKKLAQARAHAVLFDADLMARFTSKLSFGLTDAQKKAAWRILKDMEQPRPMNRLLEGDVGSGKTVVAAMAILAAVRAGHQAVLMAPTEILASQHFKSVGPLLAPFKMDIGLLTGSQDRYISRKLPNDVIEISKRKLLERAGDGTMNLLIGTHALIQDRVKFADLALLVVDEQHRFGIKQRAKLSKKGGLVPHFLSMTATPIPRTLAMSVYGDLDLAVLDELPKGRKKVATKVLSSPEQAYKKVASEVKKGRQAFVICPRIEEIPEEEKAEGRDVPTVAETHKRLTEKFPELAVDMLHGKMSTAEKARVMRNVAYGRTDILVSTSVVEVGVDVPNAAVMVVEGAERFGLAQLHQFRGRVGRGEHASFCFLVSSRPESAQRIGALEKSSDGFELAEQDLRLRGPGDFTGTKQWGVPDFAMEQVRNRKLVEDVREEARALLEKDLTLKNHPLLRERVEELRAQLHLE